jgi:outer membrane protein OmpA-like peptidoglycan-associated protein
VVAPDRDHDGLADAIDNCPDVAGPVENGGCPVYEKVIVRPDKLELREKIMFAFDRADIETESVPLLDEVVQALRDNKGFRVQIEGHADATGVEEHNQTLSEQRAAAVVAYLRDHGIAPERLSYKGFGSSVPTDSNKTVAGRENNRRVDFVVQFKIIDRSAQ